MNNHTLISGLRRRSERDVNELRDYESPPATYKKYQLVDGAPVYIGEFPTPIIEDTSGTFNGRKKGSK